MNNKGISPLIATVLILGFTVALGAIIMTWGMEFTKKMQESTEETANIQIICATDVIFDIKSACKSNGNYDVVIANDGKEDIKKWRFRLYQSESNVSSPDPIEVVINAFNIDVVSVPGINVKKIEVIPIIFKGGADVVCSQNIDSYGDLEGSVISDC